MYSELADFLSRFSVAHPLPWALLVMAVMAGASLALYAFWEVTLRLIIAGASRTGIGNRTRADSRGDSRGNSRDGGPR